MACSLATHAYAAEIAFLEPEERLGTIRARRVPEGLTFPAGALPMRGTLLDHVATSLVGAVLAEQHDEWADGRRYLGLEVLANSRLVLIPPTTPNTRGRPTPSARSAPNQPTTKDHTSYTTTAGWTLNRARGSFG